VFISRTVCITIILLFRTYIPRVFRSGADCAGIFEQSMGARNREENRIVVPARQATKAGRIDSFDSYAGI
jgi:hypothetical protein